MSETRNIPWRLLSLVLVGLLASVASLAAQERAQEIQPLAAATAVEGTAALRADVVGRPAPAWVAEAPARMGLDGGEADRIADALRREATRLHQRVERWGDAAVLHLHAARLRGLGVGRSPEGAEATLHDLLIAANLFHYRGDFPRACATLRMAGDVASYLGDERTAGYAYRNVFRLAMRGDPAECEEAWSEDAFEGLVIAAPTASIQVEPPDVALLPAVDDLRMSAVLRVVPPAPPPPVRR